MDTSMMKKPLASLLSQTWWLILLRGLVAIIFGLLICLYPDITVPVMIMFFGAFVLADGVLAVVSAIQGRKSHQDWWVLLVWGLVSIIAGALTLVMPSVTAFVLLMYIAAWAVVTGIMEIIAAIRLRGETLGRGWLIMGGLLSALFGLILFIQPIAGALAIVWLIGTFAILLGIIFVALALRMHKISKELQHLD